MYKAVLYRIGRHAFVCSLAVLGGTAAVALAFTEPSGGPTGGTVYAPVNTGGIAQTKIGNFTSSGTITGATMNGTGSICLAGNCISSWPAGGSSAGSAGTVQFSNGSGGFNGNAANFFWDNTNGRLGIGTASPTGKMELISGSDSIRLFDSSASINGTGVRHPYGASTYLIGVGYNTSNNDMGLGVMQLPGTLTVSLFYSPSTNRDYLQTYGKDLYIDTQTGTIGNVLIPSGNVGVGVSPTQKLDVNGNIKAGRLYLVDTAYSFPANNAGVGTDGLSISIRGDALSVGKRDGVSYAPVYASAYNIGSSIRFKTDVTASPYGLQDVLKLEPKRFRYIYDLSKLSIGLIAEEVAPVIPEVVAREDDGTPKAIDYGKLTVVLVGAVKELKVEVDALRAENQALKMRVESLEGR